MHVDAGDEKVTDEDDSVPQHDDAARDSSSTLQTTSEIPPPVDLDAPVKSEHPLINVGWSSVNVNVHVKALWKAACMKARRQRKVMNVCGLVSDGDGSLSRRMTIKTYNTMMKVRIWIDRVASEFVCHCPSA